MLFRGITSFRLAKFQNRQIMKKHSTYLSYLGKLRILSFFAVFLLTILSQVSYAQTKIYANTVSSVTGNGQSSLLGCGFGGLSPCYTPTVENQANALTADANTFATVKSSGGLALGIGAYAGALELKFPATIPAGTTSYIRIDTDPTLLNQLLGGNLGGLLANVVGGIALGNHSIEVGARNAAGTTVLSGSSTGSFNSSNLRLVRDANGFYYLALRPTQDYDRVYVRDVTNAVLIGTPNETKVYNAFYTSGVDVCAPVFATGYEGTGLTVDALGLGKAGVTNPSFAIDANQTNYSELSLGALGVAGSISQIFYFETPSNAGDDINLKFSVSSALLNANVLSSLTVVAYNGNTQVFSQSASNLLGADLLALLNTGQAVTVPFSPGQAFDRVEVRLSSLLNVNLTQTILIYGLTRSAGRPTFVLPAKNNASVCYNSSASLSATTLSTNELRWYDVVQGGTALATTAYNGAYNTPLLTANKVYYVASRRINCLEESGRVPITVTVNPAIIFNANTLPNGSNGFAYSSQITTATGGTPTFTYVLASGSSLPAGLTLSASGLISGTPTATGSYPFSIVATDSKGCTATANYTLVVTAALALTPGNLPSAITGTAYGPQNITPATGGTEPYVYSAINLPPGLTFDASTVQISGTPTQSGTFTIPITVTDASGNTVTSGFTIKITNPLVLPAATLASGITGKPYTPQIIPSATGGTGPYVYTASNLPPGLAFNATTNEITGTPTVAGTYTFPVSVTDADGKTITTNYTIGITNPLILPSAVLADGAAGTGYTPQAIPSATGGMGPYTYSATGVPPGLTFNPTTLQITGTPSQAGNYTVSVTVVDAQGNTASNTYPLKVTGVLSLPTAALPSGTVNVAYPTQTLPQVTGGTVPYTYIAANLPPGLNFNTTTREITGTPTLGGTYVVSLTATDANNNKATSDYTIVVNVNQPIVANATVCAGSSATLSVTNLGNGITYNWYASTGNTPLATNNAGVFVTPTVNANTTFFAEAVSGTAVSARTAVAVSTNTPANPAVVTTNNQIINSGQSTTLTATADAGNTINWFAVPTGGTSLSTGSNFTTPSLTSTTTYYVETTSANGCVSINRVPVTVTVIPSGVNTACNAASAQSTGITGICILCGITGAGNSTDANPDNFTRISLAVGALSTGYQQLIFSSAGAATDSIRLDLGLPTGLLDLSVLGNIRVNVLNGSTVVGSYALNSSVLNLALLNGTRFKATLAAGAAFDRVEVRFGGLASAISSLDIYGATIVYPNPTIISGSQTICSGSTANLAVTANGGTSIKWYDAAVGGNLLATGENFSTNTLTSTTTYYIEVAKGSCANTDRIPVVVTVTPIVLVPVLAPIASVCSGAAATLSVSNPDQSLTYKWYTSATGGTPVFTGSVFTTAPLTANITYYLEAANGNCVSASRAAAAVNVNPRPIIPTVTASSSTVNSGQTAVLTANSTETGVTFNWFDTANAATPVYTGSTFVTPPLNTTTSYYVESVSPSGCASTDRVQITITVNTTTPPVNIPCEVAATQINGVTGVALLSGVFNAALAVDNDAQTASSLVMPVGALGASVYQSLYFSSLSRVGDTLRVLVSFPQNILSAGVLNNISITTFNGATSNNDGVLLSNNLLNVQLLNGNTQALLTLIPTVPFDGAELRLNAGVVGALNSVNLNYMQRSLLAPEVISSDVIGCAGSTATLQVLNPIVGTTYRWFDASQTAVFDGANFTTPNLTADTKYYVAIVSASGCLSAKTAVNVTVQPTPALPELLSPTVNACAGTTIVLQVKNPINGIIYKWYDNLGISAGPDGTTLTVTPIANTTYQLEATNSCGSASARATATINIGAVPDSPILTPTSATIVAGTSAQLTATPSIANATVNWYSDQSLTTLVNTGLTYLTPVLNVNTTYYVTTSVVACGTSAAAQVTVNVIPGTPGTTDCGIANVTLATGFTGVNVGGDVYNRDAAIDTDINTGSTLFIPAGAIGSSVYHRLGFAGGLSNVGDTLRIKISSPGSLLSAAVLPNIILTTYNGATSNADAVSLNSQLIQLNLASNGTDATLVFIPTKQFDGVQLSLNSGLVGVLNTINFDYAQRSITAPEVSSSTPVACSGSSAILTVNNPKPNTIYKWYQGTAYQAGKDGTTFLTDPTLVAGSYDFFVTATGNNGCESPGVKVVVTITTPPSPPVATTTNPASTCVNSPATLSVQPEAGIVYNWYNAAAAGNLLVSNSNTFTTSAALQPGTYTYYVEAQSGTGCTNSTRTPITITVNQNAIASDIQISGNTNLCNAGTTTLTASSSTVTNPTFTWYSDAALTNVVNNGAVFTTTQISSNTRYYVTVSGSNRCLNLVGNAAMVDITINPVAVATDVNVSGGTLVCAGSSTVLTASSTIGNAVYTWYSDAALTTVAFSGASFTTPSLSASTIYYLTVKGNGKCENTPATAKIVSVAINPVSTANDISVSGSVSICKNSTTTLSASSTTVANPIFTWYSDANLTTIAHSGSSFTTPALTATTTYYVTIKGDNSCENTAANAKAITVTVKEYSTAADISLSNANICSGSAVTLMASSLTVTQPVFTWYSDASLTVPVFTGPSYNVSVSNTTNFYVTVKGNNKCENAAADAKIVTITVNPLAVSTDIILAGNTSVCTNTSTTLSASSTTVTNPVFTWYSDAALTNVAFVGATFATPALNANATYYVTVKGDNKCENAPANARVVQINVSAAPLSPTIASTGTTICSGNATTLSIQNPQAGVTYEWYNAANAGNLLSTGTSFTTPILTNTVNYYAQAVGAGGCANSAGRTMVTITVNPQPLVPSVSSSAINVCSGSPAVLSVVNPQSGVTYNWYTTATGGTISGSGSTFTTNAITSNTVFYVEAVSGSCNSTSRTLVAVTVLPIPSAPSLVSATSGTVCNGSTTQLSVTSPDPNLTYRWYTTSTGGTSLAQGNTFITPGLTATTIFYVESVNSSGCFSTARTPVTITVLPILAIPVVRVESTTSNSVTFSWNAVAGALGYEVSTNNGSSWQVANGITNHIIAGLMPDQAVTLIVRALGQIGCQTSANSILITGKAANPLGNEIYIPNVFTPNNDGKNDVFLVYGTTIASVKMNIYTQWGQLIYQVNSTTTGWDGTYKGVAQPSGVYVYMIEVESSDGKKVMKKGTVTLIR